MSNTITIELHADDRARLDKLLHAIDELDKTLSAASGVFSIEHPADKPKDKPDAATESPELDPTPQAEPTTPTYTKADVQRRVTELCSRGAAAKDKVREIIHKYAQNVSSLPADKYAEVMDALSGL